MRSSKNLVFLLCLILSFSVTAMGCGKTTTDESLVKGEVQENEEPQENEEVQENEEPQENEEVQENEEPQDDEEFQEVYDVNLYEGTVFTDCKNSFEERDYNFICFGDEETVNAIETIKVIIYNDNDEIIEEFEINSPSIEDSYCISPLLYDENNNTISSYHVDFIVNDIYEWSRPFIAEPSQALSTVRINVISVSQEENGISFGSCVAG